MARRKGLGTQAQIVGAGYLQEDVLIRTMGIPESCQADWEATQKLEGPRMMFESFTEGVNAFIDWGRANGGWGVEYKELGVKPAKWEPHVTICCVDSTRLGT